jgi:hemerythrin-like metal-binding protein
MAFFTWKDSFDIGNAEIDRQHRSFLELVNEYHDSASGSTRDDVGQELIDRLKAYAAAHFRFEESLMRSAGYREIERQLEQHRYFESLVADLESAPLRGRPDRLKSALSELRDWFLRHILEEDRKFIDCLRPAR